MAQPANTYTTVDVVGIREELADVIYDITPYETPFMSGMKRSSASNTYHEWQTDALRAAADNKHIEGDDTSARAITPTKRLGNYTQIFKDGITMSGTMDATNRAGRGSELAREKVKAGRAIKLDIELALFANNARVAGTNSVAGELAGAPAWITTNTDAGSGGADPTGDGTDARTDGTQRTFAETQLNAVMQSAWEAGANLDTVYLGSANSAISAGFEGNAPRRHTDAGSGKVSNVMDIYMTNFGEVSFVKSRQIRARDVLLVQSDMWAIGDLRAMAWEPLAKTGDSEKSQVVCELTLECRNEAANAFIADTGA